MAEQQNSGTGNTGNFGNQSTGTSGGSGSTGSGASTKAAKDNTSLTTGGESGSESGGTLGNVTNKVKGLYQTAADSQVGQAAKDALGQVKENATSAIDDKKANIAQGLTGVAETLRQVGDSVKPPEGEEPNKVAELTTHYTETLSQQVEKLSGYLERQDLRGLMRDVENFARRNPAIFLGGAFALGILAARFLKSPTPNNQALMKTSDVSDFGGGIDSGGFTSTQSSLGGTSTGETSENPYGGVTGIADVGNKPDSFGETSGSLGSETGGTGQFNTGSGAGTTGTTGSTGTGSTSTGSTGTGSTTTGSTSPGSTGTSSTATGSTGTQDTSTTPTPSNKTGGDFGSSKF